MSSVRAVAVVSQLNPRHCRGGLCLDPSVHRHPRRRYPVDCLLPRRSSVRAPSRIKTISSMAVGHGVDGRRGPEGVAVTGIGVGDGVGALVSVGEGARSAAVTGAVAVGWEGGRVAVGGRGVAVSDAELLVDVAVGDGKSRVGAEVAGDGSAVGVEVGGNTVGFWDLAVVVGGAGAVAVGGSGKVGTRDGVRVGTVWRGVSWPGVAHAAWLIDPITDTPPISRTSATLPGVKR